MNNRHNDAIFQIYEEGIFDRLGARAKGVMNIKTFGGTGYNQGKADSFKTRLYGRIAKDIDKFLREVQSMDGMSSLNDFETKYPEIAKKVACMAEAIGHKTPLSTQCSGTNKVDPEPTDDLYGFKCDKVTGKCKKVPAKRSGNFLRDNRGQAVYDTLEKCRAKCKANSNDNGSGRSRRRGSDGASQEQNVGRDNTGNMSQVSGNNNSVVQNIINIIYQEVKNGVPEDQAAAIALKQAGKKATPKNIAIAKERYRDAKGRFTKRPTA